MAMARWAVAVGAGWALATALAGAALVRWDIAERRAAFQAEARTAHRLLSQRAAELEAWIDAVALLAPEAEVRLPALVPAVLRVGRGAPAEAEVRARTAGHAVLTGFDPGRGRFTLLRAADPAPVALEVDIARWLPPTGWPYAADGPVAVRLVLDGRVLTLAEGRPVRGATPGFVFAKVLDPASQPFELQLQRATGPGDWPWLRLAALAVTLAAVAAAGAALWRQRQARVRAEALQRLDRVARLNTLGEMGAGLAHELNQPLAAVLASLQAARRSLDDEAPPALAEALEHGIAQARRAAGIVARLRQRVEQPAAAELQPLDLRGAAQEALALLRPEMDAAGVQAQLHGPACTVRADAVALAQILHNLLRNAVQALADEPAGRRRLRLETGREAGQGWLRVADEGPGLAPEVLARLFQPFTSTRPGGLGLGLSLSETLALGMGGTLTAHNARPRGAVFRLALPLAEP